MAEKDFSEYSLDLYLSYKYLTVEQYSLILSSFNNTYSEIIKIVTLEGIPDQELPSMIAYFQNPLCIEEIHTGNSISTKISFEKRIFPRVAIESEETLKIQLPRWTAALFLTGLIVSFGVDKYEQMLDVQTKQLEKKIKTLELQKLQQEILKQSQQIQGRSEVAINSYHQMQQNHYLFHAQIQQKNIDIVELNEAVIKNDNLVTSRRRID